MDTLTGGKRVAAEAQPKGQDTVKGDDWRHQSGCRPGTGVDPEIFFPVSKVGALYIAQVEEAKKICRVCPTMIQCLKWAIDSNQESGVAGGMSEDERRAYHRRMKGIN